MKVSTIIMTPDVLQAKSLWAQGEGKKNLHLSKRDRHFHSKEREVRCKSDTILFKHPITKIAVHLYKTELLDLSLSARSMYLPRSQRCNELRKHLGQNLL